ncbi:Van1p NDAI_0E00290 [Naumovozyma dairenensis CBS 421]|uniref:Mannan polymerase I complex VAN1 subunit n=1 Tax=Naumovozyma dairenensis (strain ATCC 10597 / BCRC 20456 / CBS 421 / NBRC 0211 / NRRL Y-12639) TaxID=1071378 RepID=G0WAS5_NAUDC|nr:hypothetical protein NDAI_0E00290 [Naumovozyma dairenensis CBS 421]CCD24845.1 hypothetical protein NDAI_0E00290 [Naumovozyma dairenensis CBS 421]
MFGLLHKFGRNSRKDAKLELPISRNNSNVADELKKQRFIPKKKSTAKNVAIGSVVSFIICALIYCGYSYFFNTSPRLGKINLYANKNNKVSTSYKTTELSDKEYYNYDFENIEADVLGKFENGVQHYLISEFGTDVLTPKDKEQYEKELAMLLDASVEKYDLKKFDGSRNGAENRDHLLLCVPLRDAESVLPLMFKHLMNMTYPHELIDLAFLVSDCSDGDNTLEALLQYSRHLQNGTLSQVFQDMDEYQYEHSDDTRGTKNLHLKYMNQEYLKMVETAFNTPPHENYDKPFRSVQIFRKDFGQVIGQGFSDRHAVKVQGIRRKLMGRARNWLMANALKPYHSWVYWRDADIELCPGTIVEDMMANDYDVLVPNVWRPLPEFLDSEQPYDLNSWIESDEALKLAKTLPEDDVIVEGYAEYPTWRVHLAYIREAQGDPTSVVDLDGVGGVSILAKAKLFRSGVHFPAFTFENHAETEGFGKMAKRMGYRVGGLPHYTIWHIYEPSDDDLKEIANKERQSRHKE